MKEKLEQIKSECRKVIELGGKATPGPWNFVDSETGDPECDIECNAIQTSEGMLDGDNLITDVLFITYSRTFSPRAAKIILMMLASLEFDGTRNQNLFELICNQWEEIK